MILRYADTKHVVSTLDASEERAEETDTDQRFTIVDATQAVVDDCTFDELRARNLYDTVLGHDQEICTITVEPNSFGKPFLEVGFHQSTLERGTSVEVDPVPAGRQNVFDAQADDPRSLSDQLERALQPIVDEYGASFAFCEVSAKSIGTFLPTDFEFTYKIDRDPT